MRGSIEDKILALHDGKREFASRLLEDSGSASALSVSELVELLQSEHCYLQLKKPFCKHYGHRTAFKRHRTTSARTNALERVVQYRRPVISGGRLAAQGVEYASDVISVHRVRPNVA